MIPAQRTDGSVATNRDLTTLDTQIFVDLGKDSTATDTANVIVMEASHGLAEGHQIMFDGAPVSGVAADTYYFVKSVSTNDVTLAATPDGTALTFSGTRTIRNVFYWKTAQSCTA